MNNHAAEHGIPAAGAAGDMGLLVRQAADTSISRQEHRSDAAELP